MVDFVEIHTLLVDYEKGDAGAFFTFNEIKNILLDQKDFTTLEGMLLELFKRLNPKDLLAFLPLITTTSDTRLNRLALFMQKAFILENPNDFSKSVLKVLINPALNVPKDTYDALYDLAIPLDLTPAIVLDLADKKAVEILSFLSPWIEKLSEEVKAEIKDPVEAAIASFAHVTYHGITIDKVDTKRLEAALI